MSAYLIKDDSRHKGEVGVQLVCLVPVAGEDVITLGAVGATLNSRSIHVNDASTLKSFTHYY